MLYTIRFLLFFTINTTLASTALFEKANALYAEQKYAQAQQVYQSILDTGMHSAALYYNLANAHYKQNHIAPSIYYYEKALQLCPDHALAKQNLVFANNMRVDVIEKLPELGVSSFITSFLHTYSITTWSILGLVFIWLCAIVAVVYILVSSTRKKRLFFSATFLSFSIALLCFGITYYMHQKQKNTTYGIVFSEQVALKQEPMVGASAILEIHQGTKVRVLQATGQWFLVALANGKQGWLLQEAINTL